MELDALIRETIRNVLRDELRSALEELRPAPAGEYLTVAQAARAAAVTPDTLRRWIHSGRLPACHAGRELRVRGGDLERFMDSAPEGRPSAEDAVEATLSKDRTR